jgi:hypothetical protein
VPYVSRPRSRTLITRSISLVYLSMADGIFSGWKRANQVA